MARGGGLKPRVISRSTSGHDSAPRNPDDIWRDGAGEDPEVSRMRTMWLAVVYQAVLDAFEVSDGGLIQRNGGRDSSDEVRLGIALDADSIRRQTRAWLTGDLHREDRETVCLLAGVDEPELRAVAATRIAGEDPLDRLVALEQHLSPAEVDSELDRLSA